MSISSQRPKQSDTSSLQQAAKMGEVKTPRRMFLISIALIYVCAFSSIYVQIPGREVSPSEGGYLTLWWWILGAALMNGCAYTWTWECRCKQNVFPLTLDHSFISANSSFSSHGGPVSVQTFEGPRAQTASPWRTTHSSWFVYVIFNRISIWLDTMPLWITQLCFSSSTCADLGTSPVSAESALVTRHHSGACELFVPKMLYAYAMCMTY